MVGCSLKKCQLKVFFHRKEFMDLQVNICHYFCRFYFQVSRKGETLTVVQRGPDRLERHRFDAGKQLRDDSTVEVWQLHFPHSPWKPFDDVRF